MSEPNDNMPKDGGPAYPATRMEKVWWTEDYLKAEEARLKTTWTAEEHLKYAEAPYDIFDRRFTFNTLGVNYPGMSLRDYFAGQALSAAGPSMGAHWSNGIAQGYAEHAYQLADAMLKERAK